MKGRKGERRGGEGSRGEEGRRRKLRTAPPVGNQQHSFQKVTFNGPLCFKLIGKTKQINDSCVAIRCY